MYITRTTSRWALRAACAVAASGLFIGTTSAADFVPSPEPVPHGWTNFYIGGYVGGGAIVNDNSLPAIGPGNFNGIGGEGLVYGGRAGFNYQFSDRIVVGIEGEVGSTDMETELNIPGLLSFSAKPDFTASVSGRAGFLATPDTLLYALGGWSHADYDVNLVVPIVGFAANVSETFDGFHVGTGIETKLTHSLTARVEYRYTDYAGEDFGTGGILNAEPSSHTGTVGLAWQLFSPSTGTIISPVADPDPLPEVVATWTGPYLGGYVGGGGIVNEISLPGVGPGNFNGIGGEGVVFSGMGGFNYQIGQWLVVGVQGEAGVDDLETELNIPGLIHLRAAPDFTAAVSGRVGWLPSPSTLLYAFGGWSYAEYQVDVTIPILGIVADFSEKYDGFHVGGGIETKLSDTVTARAEYRYTEYGGEDWGTGGFLDVEPSSHVGRVGLAWNFYNVFAAR